MDGVMEENGCYSFDAESAFNEIRRDWTRWCDEHGFGNKKFVVGISGGKDSTVVAALATRIFGKDRVVGVLMPCNGQKDLSDSFDVVNHLEIFSYTVDIGDAFESLKAWIDGIKGVKISRDALINMPARLRMTTLYAVAQTVDGIVLNTCNLSEDVCGYSTLFGDNAGSYAPLQGLTVTEIIALGDWLGLPYALVHKTPVDGLQPQSDEERLGFTYEKLDRYIRLNEGDDEFKCRVDSLFEKNKFKMKMVVIPGPKFHNFENFVLKRSLVREADEIQQ